MSTMGQELRYAARAIRANPGYVLVTVLTLAIGIGVNAMIFSVVDSIVLRPMPLVRAERLVQLRDVELTERREGGTSLPDFVSWRERSRTLAGIAAYHDRNMVLVVPGGAAEKVEGEAATTNLFALLGVAPAHGRLFRPEEGLAGGPRAVLLSHTLWASRFGADPGVVGRAVTIDGDPHTVVGVMPPRFGFPDNQQMWVPITGTDAAADRGARYLRVVAQLKPGVSPAAAQNDLGAIAARLAAEHPESNADHGVRVVDFKEAVSGPMRPILLLMLGAVGFVLLIVCANVASLAMARASARQTDIAVRFALGARFRQVARLLLTESVMIGLLGGVGGIAVAYGGLYLMRTSLPFEPPLWVSLEINGAVLLYTLVIAVGTGLLFGIAPVLWAARPEPAVLLRQGGRGIAKRSGESIARVALVVGQLAASTVLLICALLMVRSLLRIQEVDPGFDPRRILTAEITAGDARYSGPGQRHRFFEQLLEGARGLGGVEGAAAVTRLPVGSAGYPVPLLADGAAGSGGREIPAEYRAISAGYFAVLGVPVERGRPITASEAVDAAPVMVVSRGLAERAWPGQDPIGRRLKLRDSWRTVVGVVPDAPLSGLSESPRSQIYVPLGSSNADGVFLVVRTRSAASTGPALRRLVAAMDPGVPVTDLKGMEQVVAEALWQQRLFGGLFGIFALIATLIAVVGVYGVISYGVSLRRHEIAVRVALGATPGAVIRLVARQGAILAALGIGLGTLAALGLTRVLASQLYGVGATDPPTFTGSVLVLGAAALLAAYLPARRAASADPTRALASM